ncbi:MAG: hypothetical protein ACMUIU_19735 [bacterium]
MADSMCVAQSGNVFQFSTFTTQPLRVPTWSNPVEGSGDILVDNFEYWDSPLNHGWFQLEPPFPVYGFGIGYATILSTVLDFQNGSRVLDVYRPSSIFLLGTPYEKYAVFYNLFTPPAPGVDAKDGIDLSEYPIISYEYSTPLGIEPWDIFDFSVVCTTQGGYTITIRIRPIEPPYGQLLDSSARNITVRGYKGQKPSLEIIVDMCRCFIGGLGWAIYWLDITEVVNEGLAEYSGSLPAGDAADWEVVRAVQVIASGQIFRLDNIIFRKQEYTRLLDPYLFKIGPRYAQIFEHYRYLFFADYETGAKPVSKVTDFLLVDNFVDLFITDPNDIADIWVNEYGADPNKFGKEPDTNVSALMGKDFIVDPQLPIFADANFRLGNNAYIAYIPNTKINQTLNWNATVGGIGANGVQFFEVTPLEINPYDGMPTYIPVYYNALSFIAAFGKTFIGPQAAYYLESALYNAGFTFWPNIAKLDFIPQFFEDIIVSLEVSNGRISDMETFPISVVNYPVENYPPYIEDVDDQIFYVGSTNNYVVGAIDADCTIFSLSVSPTTSHKPATWGEFRTDMDTISWTFTLRGQPSYQYGPWIQSMIDPCSGLISFTPKFEGAYNGWLVAIDNRGASGLAYFTIFCVNKGTWLNHPPIIIRDWESPIITKAGEKIILSDPMFQIIDPDGDAIATSSNIGSCGCTCAGKFIWSFQPNFPGIYNLELFAFDIRGGYAILEEQIIVKPWWSY